MKNILFIFDRKISTLPPLLAIIDSLIGNNHLTFLVSEHEAEIEGIYKDKNISFISFNKFSFRNILLKKIYYRYFRGISMRMKTKQILKDKNFDFVWFASAEAAFFYKKPILDIKYNLNIYELYDKNMRILKGIAPIALNADKVIVPEYNRANILRVWLNLKKTPFVIPNKPLSIPSSASYSYPDELVKIQNKKIILYQGHIMKLRNIDALCETVSKLENYVLVLMGTSSDGYLDELQDKYQNIIHVGFITPPEHLYITKLAYIGVVTYGHFALNGVFCAPNKIWEYSSFGVPMLANNIPGLVYTVGDKKAGCCIDMSNSSEIEKAIKDIDENYKIYNRNSYSMFNSFDIKKSIIAMVSN